MKKNSRAPATVEEYIARFPPAVRSRLKAIRGIVRKIAPDAVEKMGYGVAAYELNGMLLYFAGFPRHVGLYPSPSAIRKFQKEIGGLPTAQGTVRFPNDRPLPLALIRKIVKFRVQENRKRETKKPARK